MQCGRKYTAADSIHGFIADNELHDTAVVLSIRAFQSKPEQTNVERYSNLYLQFTFTWQQLCIRIDLRDITDLTEPL